MKLSEKEAVYLAPAHGGRKSTSVQCLDKFRLQVFQVLIIQVKLPLQCAIGDTLVLLEPVDDLCEDVLKCHDCPSVNSSSRALASLRSNVSNPSVNHP